MNYKREKNSALKKRVSITLVDVLIFAIIVLFGVLIYSFIFTAANDGETYGVSYVIKASEVRDELSDRITVGDAVYSEEGTYMGRVRAYDVTASMSPLTGQTIPGLYDLYITVEAESESPDEVLISGLDIKVEGEYLLRTAVFSFEGVCISIGK